MPIVKDSIDVCLIYARFFRNSVSRDPPLLHNGLQFSSNCQLLSLLGLAFAKIDTCKINQVLRFVKKNLFTKSALGFSVLGF
jgi:hypothetical protein